MANPVAKFILWALAAKQTAKSSHGDRPPPARRLEVGARPVVQPQSDGQLPDGVGVGAVPAAALQVADRTHAQPGALGQRLLGQTSGQAKLSE